MLPSFAAGPYECVHDNVDCCIIWNTGKLARASDAIIRSYSNGEIPDDTPSNRLAWRQFLTVSFNCLASPQVTLSVACTHSARGHQKHGSRATFVQGSPATADRFMSQVARHALEKFLRISHLPSFAAGPEHVSLMMGDFNTTNATWPVDVAEALISATQYTPLHAQGQSRRDHAVVFHGKGQWDTTMAKLLSAALSASANSARSPDGKKVRRQRIP